MTYCPDHDPILIATSVTCGSCAAESFPVEAEWVTDRLILASFEQAHEPGCPRRNTACGVVLIDLDAPTDQIPHVKRPRTCKGTTKADTPCKNPAGKASSWCATHDPTRQGRHRDATA